MLRNHPPPVSASHPSAHDAVAPFIGVLLSRVILRESFTQVFFAALLLMMAGAWLASSDA